jgi:hypothetical protein
LVNFTARNQTKIAWDAVLERSCRRGEADRIVPAAILEPAHNQSGAECVAGAGNSGGWTRHKRTKDGNRYLKLAFSHAAVWAIQHFPQIRAFYRATARRKPPALARALVAKELARIVYFMLKHKEPFNGTFEGKPLSRTRTPKWPRLVNPLV